MTQRDVKSTAKTELRLIRLELDDTAWSRLVEHDPHALPFHHPAWARTLAECYGFPSFGLGLVGADGHVIAGAPVVETRSPLGRRRWISLPFTDFCPPLVGGDRPSQVPFESAIEAAMEEGGVTSVELRGAPAGRSAFEIDSGLRHVLELDADAETVSRRFNAKVRNAIRQAQQSGVVVGRAEREKDLSRVFYELHLATRRRLGVPVQPRRYFSQLWQRIVEPGLGFVLLARANGRPVAGAVFLAWNGTVVYKYSASDATALRLRPNNAIIWHAIQTACEDGYSRLDFGRSDHGDEGLSRFKRHWGAKEMPLIYTSLGEKRTGLARRGPLLSLSREIIRRSPSFVCRAIGTAAYRYAA
jgi:CelD/BcsL family acetyltransferase involved in cellulose biosynthesis